MIDPRHEAARNMSQFDGREASHMSGGAPILPHAPAEEPRYTLAEAEQILNERICTNHGHSYDEISNSAGQVMLFVCSVCEKTLKVVENA